MKDQEISSFFSQRLSVLVEARGMKQKELSKASGITEALISSYISGKRLPGYMNIIRIAQALEISPALFFCNRADINNMSSPCWLGEQCGAGPESES